MGCLKLSYHLNAEPRLRCVYNAADGDENHIPYPISKASGSTVEKNSYDAWGRLRNASTLEPFAHDAQPNLLLRRGYTYIKDMLHFGIPPHSFFFLPIEVFFRLICFEKNVYICTLLNKTKKDEEVYY